ncbi:MAG: hypothetical protein C0468_03050 [Planctomyces sp.]|nr:hypothetical protein [Planctomyces sp.]
MSDPAQRTPAPAPSTPGTLTPAGTPAAAHAASAEPRPGDPKPIVSFEQFAALDLRVARVVHAEPHPKADRLLKLQLDDGSGTPRQICAGVREHYTPEQMIGRLIVIVANLAPRVIRGEESRGMLLAASDAPKDAGDAQRRVVLLRPDDQIAPGSIVS